MPSPIVFNDDSLARGVEGASNILTQFLLAKQKPVWEAEAKSNASRQWLQQMFPQLQSPMQPQMPQLGMAATGSGQPTAPFMQGQAPQQSSPIQQVKMGMSGNGRAEAVQRAQFNPDNLTEEQLTVLAVSPFPEHRNLAKTALDQRKVSQDRFVEDRKFHTKGTEDIQKKINGLRESVPAKRMAVSQARNAIETGNLGFFSKDSLADLTGIPAFRTAKGAQLITAGKENLLSNMSRVSAKGQNMWFEQRLNSMFPQIGQSKEANLTVLEMIEGEQALDTARLAKYDELAAQDIAQYGYVRNDMAARLSQAMEPVEQEVIDKTSYRLKVVDEQDKGGKELRKEVTKKVSKGTPLTPLMFSLFKERYGDAEQAMANAKKQGYTVYSPAKIQGWME